MPGTWRDYIRLRRVVGVCGRRVGAAGHPRCATICAMTLEVYTDGACLGNPGPGGWAWAVLGGPFASGVEAASTNQRMEIMAAMQAVRTLGPAGS